MKENAVSGIDKVIDKICSYLNCKKDELYYIERINDITFNPVKIFLEENNISYCRNHDGYAYIIIKNKQNETCFITNEKFMKDLKVIERIINRNKRMI
jgi:hypothetical protein